MRRFCLHDVDDLYSSSARRSVVLICGWCRFRDPSGSFDSVSDEFEGKAGSMDINFSTALSLDKVIFIFVDFYHN